MPTTRQAVVSSDVNLDTLNRYLPVNYHAYVSDGGVVMIVGHDVAGWTLDGYVIPRLASGLIFAQELD
jgi:hypothetical protein